MSKYPKKPEKLDADCAWVSVVEVANGTGEKADERAWCAEFVGTNIHPLETIAHDSAQSWYRTTGQIGECVVTFRIEDAEGRVTVAKVTLTHVLKAKAELMRPGDAPWCPDCGTVTVRSRGAFRCVNCGWAGGGA